jgi:signal transduction histidine kinase
MWIATTLSSPSHTARMMHAMDQSRPSPEHRHKRRALWAKLWLERIMRLLSMLAGLPLPNGWRAAMDRVLMLMTKVIVALVLIRAAQLRPPRGNIRNPKQVARAEARHDVRSNDSLGSMRSTIGSDLRRAVRVNGAARKDLQARAEKLLNVLNALETFAASIAHRARNGMTRLLGLHNGVALALPTHPATASSANAAPLALSCGGAFDAAAPP